MADLAVPEPSDALWPKWTLYGVAFAGGVAIDNLILGAVVDAAKDGAEQKPENCPTGTIPIDQGKKKFGLGKDDVHGIKEGVGAGPRTWTGIAPNGEIWTGGPGGVGENHGPFGDYLPNR